MNTIKYRRIVLILAAGGLLALVMVLVAFRPIRAAGPWYVAPGGDDGSDCLSPSAPCASINGALGKASSGDTIYVGVGTYTGTGDEVVLVGKDITLSGGWDETFTTQGGMSTLDGEHSRRGMGLNGGVTVTLERFLLQNGSRPGQGFSGSGAAIYNDGCTLILNSCLVRGNWAEFNGGGIFSYWGTLTLNDTIVRDNVAQGSGGGICNERGPLTLNHSTINDNTASSGGGVYVELGSLTLTNSTVSGNTAYEDGGGICSYGGIVVTSNSTVSRNRARSGGGVSFEPLTGGSVTLQNSILAGNTGSSAPDCSGSTGSSGYSLIGDTSDCAFTPGPGDLTNVDADLGPLIGSPGYHPLLSGSPAIDAVPLAQCSLTTDQRGVVRPQGPACDMGAYEWAAAGPAASVSAFAGAPQHSPPSFAFNTPLQVLVMDAAGNPVSSVEVAFSAPASGPSGTFADSGTNTTTAETEETGIATAATFTANGLTGNYDVTATASGIANPVSFELGNIGWYVSSVGDDANDCQSPATPCATVNGALGKPGFGAGDTVLVTEGTYTGTGAEVVLLGKDAKLSGGWDGTFVTQSGSSTVDGQGSRRGIAVDFAVSAVIERFTAQNGYDYYGVGGIHNDGTMILNSSTVRDNTSRIGGGVGNSGFLTLNNCTVSGNRSVYDGGGINNGGALTLDNSTVSDNTARDGGGIRNYLGAVTLHNTIVAGNTASGSSPDCVGTISSAGYNLIGDTSDCSFAPATGDLTGVSPELGLLIGSPGYHPLVPGSPAIDAVPLGECTLPADERGVARPQGPACDMGAYECAPPGPAINMEAVGGSYQRTAPLFPFEEPFQAMVLDAVGTPVGNVLVTFVAPASGASGTFADSGTNITTVETDEGGVATAATFTANASTGSYVVSASASGVATTVEFSLANLAWYVAPGADDANDCLTPATACATINGVLGKPGFVAGDTVLVATGTYTGAGNEVVLIAQDVRLSGGWDIGFTAQAGTSTLDGEGVRRGMTVDGDAFVFAERFTVHNGVAEAGGGIYIHDGSLTLQHSTIKDSTADRGGGIWTYGPLMLRNCTVSGNEEANWASYGAGIGSSGGNITLISSTVSGNMGEGINCGGGAKLTLENSSVSGNEDLGITIEWHYAGPGTLILNESTVSGNLGPGIRSTGGNLFLSQSTISHNAGGGISSSGGNVDLDNCTVSANTSTTGGGILNDGGTITLTHSTVSGNTAYTAGGGINALGGTVVVQNSILAGNRASSGPDCAGSITSADHNLIGDTSGCSLTLAPGDLTNVDPAPGMLVGSPAYHPLLPSSPAVDAVPLAYCSLTTDQRGAARPQGSACDMGAYEYTTPGPAASISAVGGTPQRTPPSFPFGTPLQAAVLDDTGAPVSNIPVAFAAMASGASGTFDNTGTYSTTAKTDESGIATATTFTANELSGSYTVTATVSGIVTPAEFLLANLGWYVLPGGDDANDCQTPATPCATVDGPLAKPDFVAGDTVAVAIGTYTGSGDEVVLLDQHVTLSGGWNDTFTKQNGTSTIDAQSLRRGITVDTGVIATIDRLTVEYGSRDGWEDSGGGIYNASMLTLSHSAIHGNSAYFGGGIYNDGILYLSSSTVSGNTARGGGGIHNEGILNLNSSTVSRNSAQDYRGGGIANQDGASVVLQNTIVAGNTAPEAGLDCWGTIDSSGYNLVGSTSGCTFIPSAGDLTEVFAQLGPLEGSPAYHPLLPSSPALDAGSCPGVISDQRGMPRPIDMFQIANADDGCDIGAYEVQLIGFSTKTINRSAALPGDVLTYTITLKNGGDTELTNVHVTDTLPISLTYQSDSLSATSGSYGYSNGVITWTGSINAGEAEAVTYRATVNQGVPLGTSVINYAVISGGGEILVRSAYLEIRPQYVYLPCLASNHCPNPDFFDDFGDPTSGWAVEDDEYVRSEYLNGEYRVLSKQAGYFYLFRAPACDRQNYVVEVDARWAGASGSSYGLLFGLARDYSRYYLFDMNTDYKQFRLLRRDPGSFETVVPITDAPAINGGTASNHLKVTRNGTEITLEVNGTVLVTWYDGTIGGLTGAGLVTNPYSNRPTSDARFDNFSMVSLPGTGASAQGPSGVVAQESQPGAPNAWTVPAPADLGW